MAGTFVAGGNSIGETTNTPQPERGDAGTDFTQRTASEALAKELTVLERLGRKPTAGEQKRIDELAKYAAREKFPGITSADQYRDTQATIQSRYDLAVDAEDQRQINITLEALAVGYPEFSTPTETNMPEAVARLVSIGSIVDLGVGADQARDAFRDPEV